MDTNNNHAQDRRLIFFGFASFYILLMLWLQITPTEVEQSNYTPAPSPPQYYFPSLSPPSPPSPHSPPLPYSTWMAGSYIDSISPIPGDEFNVTMHTNYWTQRHNTLTTTAYLFICELGNSPCMLAEKLSHNISVVEYSQAVMVRDYPSYIAIGIPYSLIVRPSTTYEFWIQTLHSLGSSLFAERLSVNANGSAVMNPPPAIAKSENKIEIVSKSFILQPSGNVIINITAKFTVEVAFEGLLAQFGAELKLGTVSIASQLSALTLPTTTEYLIPFQLDFQSTETPLSSTSLYSPKYWVDLTLSFSNPSTNASSSLYGLPAYRAISFSILNTTDLSSWQWN